MKRKEKENMRVGRSGKMFDEESVFEKGNSKDLLLGELLEQISQVPT